MNGTMTAPAPDQSHDQHVDGQFGPQAGAYVTSAVHAAGEDLDRIEAMARAVRPARAIDLGTGGGHVAYRLAGHAADVIACDLSAAMLDAVAAEAKARGLGNVATCEAPAERLPFADGEFDFAACRFSAHHWHGFEAGLAEARRVLRTGATGVFVDTVSPGRGVLDTHLQAVELLRDTSHGCNRTVAEWCAALERAGFAVDAVQTGRLRMDFATWIARMATPELNAQAVRALQQAASAEVREHFAIEPDGSFMLDRVLIEVTAR